uniref:ADP-ribosylation factor-like protein 9 n=1 Tax=Eptatretus burgeri TaxID=7764 RepID=A0A8C4R8W9_EPTBU
MAFSGRLAFVVSSGAALGAVSFFIWTWNRKKKCPCENIQTEDVVKRVVILGLDGAGKSSMLRHIMGHHWLCSIAPTEGTHGASLRCNGLLIHLLEVGGRDHLRSYWDKYLQKADLLVFVLDASDHDRMPLVKSELRKLLQSKIPFSLLMLANKQDVQGACNVTQVHENLALSEVMRGRKLFLLGTESMPRNGEPSKSLQDAKSCSLTTIWIGGRSEREWGVKITHGTNTQYTMHTGVTTMHANSGCRNTAELPAKPCTACLILIQLSQDWLDLGTGGMERGQKTHGLVPGSSRPPIALRKQINSLTMSKKHTKRMKRVKRRQSCLSSLRLT